MKKKIFNFTNSFTENYIYRIMNFFAKNKIYQTISPELISKNSLFAFLSL